VQAFQYLGQRRVQRLHRFSHQRLCIAGFLPSVSYCDTTLLERVATLKRQMQLEAGDLAAAIDEDFNSLSVAQLHRSQ